MKQYTHLGFNNWLRTEAIVAIQVPYSKPAGRSIQQSRKDGTLIDMSQGRKVKSIVMLSSNRMVVSSLAPETIISRMEGLNEKEEKEAEEA